MANDLFEIFPFNLSRDIFKDETKAIHIHADRLIAELNTLDERRREILKLRYRDKLSLKETGERIGLTRERVRQLEVKARADLRQPGRICNYSSVPQLELRELQTEVKRLKKAHFRLKEAFEEIDRYENVAEDPKKIAENTLILDKPITVLNMDTRTKNTLLRNSLQTVRELTGCTSHELVAIKNMSSTSVQAVRNALAEVDLHLLGE